MELERPHKEKPYKRIDSIIMVAYAIQVRVMQKCVFSARKLSSLLFKLVTKCEFKKSRKVYSYLTGGFRVAWDTVVPYTWSRSGLFDI